MISSRLADKCGVVLRISLITSSRPKNGAGIDESHDGKGITITKGIGKENPHITLSWSQVEKRIGELIRTDRYLNPKEKERYPQWLESQEERRDKIEETKRNREILSNAPSRTEISLAVRSFGCTF